MSDQQKPTVYNKPRFKVTDYDFESFAGPAAGEKMQDFALTDVESQAQVHLSDFLGKWVLIETGSTTCSMYTKDIAEMKSLRDEFADVEFLLVYVREAHPGERRGPHESIADKLDAARTLAPRYGEHRRILVDNIDGDFHRAYGSMPNVVYIIRPDGTVHYRCNWAAPAEIRAALNDRANFHYGENADMKTIQANRGKLNMVRTMWTGGLIALYDFARNLPPMIAKHAKADAYYRKQGRFKKQ